MNSSMYVFVVNLKSIALSICRPTVEQLKIMYFYFSFSECRCNPYGSLNRSCNRYHGRCHCHENVIGRQCDRCQSGYWHLESGRGCKQCVCNTTGSDNNVCDYYTGQCNCKPGVGGIQCNQCLHGYYGFSERGCRSKYKFVYSINNISTRRVLPSLPILFDLI